MQTHDEEPVAWQSNAAATPQPPPLPGRTEITPLVIADLGARRLLGIQQYGTPLTLENGRDGLIDLYQEILDAIVYIKQYMLQREKQKEQLSRQIHKLYALSVHQDQQLQRAIVDVADSLSSILEKKPV